VVASREVQVVGVERFEGEEQQHHLQGKKGMSYRRIYRENFRDLVL